MRTFAFCVVYSDDIRRQTVEREDSGRSCNCLCKSWQELKVRYWQREEREESRVIYSAILKECVQ